MFTSIKKISNFDAVTTTSGSDLYVAENDVTTGVASLNGILDAAKPTLAGTFVRTATTPTEGQIAQFKSGQWVPTSGLVLASAPNVMSGPIARLFKPTNVWAPNMHVYSKKNEVFAWGQNAAYQLAYDGDRVSVLAPIIPKFFDADGTDYLINNPTVSVVDIQTTDRHGAALLSDGTVWLKGGYLGHMTGAGNIIRDPGIYTRGGFIRVYMPRNETIVSICLYSTVTQDIGNVAAVTSTGHAYIWGDNRYGQCGTDDTIEAYGPVRINHPDIVGKISKVSLGGSMTTERGLNTVVITTDGQVWVAGANPYGQLGTGRTGDTRTFTRAKIDANTFIENVVDVGIASSARSSNVFVIKSDGTLWGAGRNNFSQLGDGTTNDSLYFKQIEGVSNVSKMGFSALDTVHCIALTTTGKVFVWGNNQVGQCGTGSVSTSVDTPRLVEDGGATDIIVDLSRERSCSGYIKNKLLYASGYRVYTDAMAPAYPENQVRFKCSGIRNVVDAVFLAYSQYHATTIMLTEDGSLYGNGEAAYALFGADGTYPTPVKLM